MILYDIIWYYMILYDSIILYDIMRYYMILYVLYMSLLHVSAPLHSALASSRMDQAKRIIPCKWKWSCWWRFLSNPWETYVNVPFTPFLGLGNMKEPAAILQKKEHNLLYTWKLCCTLSNSHLESCLPESQKSHCITGLHLRENTSCCIRQTVQ